MWVWFVRILCSNTLVSGRKILSYLTIKPLSSAAINSLVVIAIPPLILITLYYAYSHMSTPFYAKKHNFVLKITFLFVIITIDTYFISI